jgi:multicomponent Na+:H+ antiporter subunit F
MIPTLALWVILPLLGGGVLLAFVRLWRGPSLPDRVVALDLIASLSICIIAVYGMGTAQPVLLDVAIVLALLSFLGTIAFARYLERRV